MLKQRLIDHFGSATRIAEFLKISQSSVSQWGVVIPEKQALRIEKLTNGALRYDPALYTKSA
ncbi:MULTISPECIES: Cro/CI family transcriptional regulator [Marinomonas]|uniref:Cro/CI family transcriptional regulator n=2 Tax=Marinomonas TaxID=28253 RepID=A0ABT3KGF0_9GAMM|nr:Cro/CI family transcriptional regulator [Marinomonas sp. KJ51-3]MCW4629622.1 Cro/CI family transcriptional regulator [Marinomonas sp. KJ51-3]